MDFSSDAATRRRTAGKTTSRLLNALTLGVLALAGMTWSGESLAQSCDITPITTTPNIGPANGTLTYSFRAEGACAATVTGTINVLTGGATVAPTTFTAAFTGAPVNATGTINFTVNLGAVPGVNGTVRVECQTGGCSPASGATFAYATNNDFDYIANVPTPVVANQITPFTVGTNLQLNGAPGGQATTFTNITTPLNYGTVTPDAAGDASTTQSIFTAGNYVVRGTINCPTAFVLEGCAAVAPVDMPVQIEPVSLTVVGSNTPTTPSGTPLNLTVAYGSASIPAADGTNINWSVTAQPAGGDGAVTGNAILSGESDATFTATVPGTYTVTANSGCTFCAPGLQNYTVTVSALPFTLTAISANPATGTVGTALPFTVRLEQGGLPVNAANIQWAANAPFAPASFTSATDAAGDASASFTPSAAGSFTGVVTATYDPDGVPANGDEVSVAFDAGVNAVPTLVINSGDNQTTPVGSNFPAVLSVTAEDSGVAAVGVTINWLVTSGAATITSSGPTDAFGEAHLSVTPTAPGLITISATRQDAPAVSVNFVNLNATALPFVINPVTANPATGTVGTAMPLTVRLLQGGTPVNAANIQWTAGAPFAPATFNSTTNAAGDAVASFTPSAAGSFAGVITATYDPDGVPANGDEVSFAYDANVSSVPTLVVNSGDNQTTPVGTAFPAVLSVTAEDSGVAAVGVTINWLVTSGNATIVSSGPTDALGESNLTVTPTAPGLITISATRQDAPAVSVNFVNLNATALPYVINAVSANPATGTAGTAIPMTVRLLQGGTPVNAANIQWTANAPFAPATFNSTTNAAGDAVASFTPSAAGTFTGAVTATYDPDGVPANGDEVSVSFDANIAFVPTLTATGGGGQNALVGATFAAPLQVNALNSGVPAAGVGINWTITGDATLVASGPTDAAGNASATVTAGTTSGAVTITATRQDAPAATAVFNLTVNALGALTIVSGDTQTLAAGVASAPLEVELTDAGGLPVAGATINWSTTAGTLTNATSTTDAAGIASNTVTTTTAGSVEVTASSPLATTPATFALKGALSSLAGLSPIQESVASALDDFCPTLAALPSPTPAQQDLLQQCQALSEAAAIDPDATVDALDQLMADVALTQANAAFGALQSQFQNLKTRIAALRSGTNGTSFGGLALNTPVGPISLGALASSLGADSDPAEIGADFSRWGFFAAGTIGRGEADPGVRNPAYDYDIEGLTAGLDYRKSDKWIIGGSLGYTRQDTELPGERGGLDTTGWTVSAYTTFYQQDSWYMDGVLTWGRNSYETLRRIRYTLPVPGGGTTTVDQTARADTDGDLLSTAYTFGRDFNRGAWGIGPYSRLLYTRVGFDAINETLETGEPGSGLGLRIDNRDISSLASVIGTKFTYTHSADWGVLMPHLQLEWEHEFKDDPQAIEARFINDPTGTAMVVRGDPLDTDYFRLGLGMSMVLTEGRSGFFYFEQLVGRNGMSQWNLALGLRMEF